MRVAVRRFEFVCWNGRDSFNESLEVIRINPKSRIMGTICCIGPEPRTDNEFDVNRANANTSKPDEFSKSFTMDVQWNCTLGGKEARIPVDKLTFSATSCQFAFRGVDEKGSFAVAGKVAINGAVQITLTHSSPQFSKNFRGKLAENVITGEFDEPTGRAGSFKLEIISTVWKSGTAFLAVKNTSEYVGLGMFSYGCAVFAGTPQGKEEVQLTLAFADGKAGLATLKVAEEIMNGKVQSPSGAEDLLLALRNEF